MIYINTDKTKLAKEYQLPESEELFVYLAFILKIDLEVARRIKCLQFIEDKMEEMNIAFCTDGQ